ncbi:uncharacterized protein LOC126086740 isoform X4 [Elephas maximus indicus]|uniref:uncharacterized protein LOC126086740 isoform X4 n=1 Tax=Elephas maximus indicus TaxID=99487 RepID=UPI00211713DF|nr:uncharacterized protein LOC126086740 isoform X4 [Elephas maximus indicus]
MICCQHIKILRILTKGPAFHFVLDSTNDGASPGYGVRTLVLEGDPVEELRTQMHEVTDMIINTLQSEPWGHEQQVQAGLEQFEAWVSVLLIDPAGVEGLPESSGSERSGWYRFLPSTQDIHGT